MGIINQGFDYGVISAAIAGARSNTGFEYGVFSFEAIPKSILPPTPVTMLYPYNGVRTPQFPVFEFTSAKDSEGRPLHFKIETNSTNNFTPPAFTFESISNQTGWQYSTDNGASWLAFPVGGVTYNGTVRVKYTTQVQFPIQALFTRIFGYNSLSYSQTQTIISCQVGNKIFFELATPIETDTFATNLVPVIIATLPTDGAVPSEMKLYVCNNAYDVSPTWENASTQANTTGEIYTFVNRIKTNAKWGVNFRVVVDANDSTGALSIDGFGFTFN